MAMPDQPFRNESPTRDPWIIRITPKEVYDSVLALKGSVDTSIGELRDIKKDLEDHEDRIRLLERARWPLTSIVVLISLASLIIGFINLSAK
jgi:hypothetical protein